MSIRPCFKSDSAFWKSAGSFCRMVCSITRRPAKPISAPGSETITSASEGKLAVTPPVVGSTITAR